MTKLLSYAKDASFCLLTITLINSNIFGFAAPASGEQPKVEVCRCGTTTIYCKDIKDFTYTRPQGGLGGIAGSMKVYDRLPQSIRSISYNSDERNMTISYNSKDNTNVSKTIVLTKEQDKNLIDKIKQNVFCNPPKTTPSGNDIALNTLAYNMQDNNKPLKFTEDITCSILQNVGIVCPR